MRLKNCDIAMTIPQILALVAVFFLFGRAAALLFRQAPPL